jgi:hypothetical protein
MAVDIKKEVLRRTRPFQNKIEILVEDQSTEDIIEAMVKYHKADRKDYDKICLLFDGATAEEVGFNIWNFLRKNVDYNVEGDKLQTIRTPGALVATGEEWGADCKNYSLFTGGVIDALNRKTDAQIDWCYRFASYKFFNKNPYHVFVVMYPGSDDEIWVDAVLSYYDYKKKPTYVKDVKPMAIARISGINDPILYDHEVRRLSGVVVGRRARIGDDGDDEGDGGIDFGDDGSGDDVETSTTSTNTSGDNGFDLSSSSSVTSGAATASSPDINDVTDPAASASTAAPADATPGYVDSSVQNQANAAAASVNQPSALSKIFSALTGGGTSSGASGGGAGAGTSSGGSAQKQTGTQSGQTINVNVPASGSSTTNWMPYVLIGGAALVAILLLTKKK